MKTVYGPRLTSSSKKLQAAQKYSPMQTPQLQHTCAICNRWMEVTITIKTSHFVHYRARVIHAHAMQCLLTGCSVSQTRQITWAWMGWKRREREREVSVGPRRSVVASRRRRVGCRTTTTGGGGNNGKQVHTYRLDVVPIQLVPVFLRRGQPMIRNKIQPMIRKKEERKKDGRNRATKVRRQASRRRGGGMGEKKEEHGTVDSLWQWRQWKTSPQQGARIRHRLR